MNAPFLGLSKGSQGYSSLKPANTPEHPGPPLMEREGVDENAYSVSDSMDKAMRFVTYTIFERLEFFILNFEPLMKSDERLELYKYQSEGDALQLVFHVPVDPWQVH